jgi:hypothetical protein
MTFTEDLATFYAEFGEAVTVNGIAATGIFDRIVDNAFGITPSGRALLRVPASVSAAVGNSVVRASVTYTIASVDYADFSEAELILTLK